jgi:hypothetical protein
VKSGQVRNRGQGQPEYDTSDDQIHYHHRTVFEQFDNAAGFEELAQERWIRKACH